MVALLLVLAGASLRLLPHAPNFTPVAAIALFAGVYFSKRIALLLPLGVMMISDMFIGYYEPKLMISVYGSFVLCTVLGFWLKKHKNWYTVGGSAILSSVLFFLITNFAFWAFSAWYPKSFAGIVECYFMALPFFRNTLIGDLFYVSVFFGVYELVDLWIKSTFKEKEGSPAPIKI